VSLLETSLDLLAPFERSPDSRTSHTAPRSPASLAVWCRRAGRFRGWCTMSGQATTTEVAQRPQRSPTVGGEAPGPEAPERLGHADQRAGSVSDAVPRAAIHSVLSVEPRFDAVGMIPELGVLYGMG